MYLILHMRRGHYVFQARGNKQQNRGQTTVLLRNECVTAEIGQMLRRRVVPGKSVINRGLSPVSLATYAITGDVRAAMYGGLTGAIMGGVGAYTQSWGFASKLLVRSTAGGVSSVLQGGKFKYGFKFTALNESLMAVYDHMAARTNELGEKAADADGARMGVDRTGSVRTDGTTGVVNVFGEKAKSQSLLVRAGLTMEDQLAVGTHWYDRPGMLGSTSRALHIPELINAVGKVHDYLNSWNYSETLGKSITRGPFFDTAYDVYSFAGMVPAAQFTSMYLAGSTGGGGALLAVQLEERKWCTVCDR